VNVNVSVMLYCMHSSTGREASQEGDKLVIRLTNMRAPCICLWILLSHSNLRVWLLSSQTADVMLLITSYIRIAPGKNEVHTDLRTWNRNVMW